MLRLHDGQVSLWEQLLPAEVRLPPTELATIDALLDEDGGVARLNVELERAERIVQQTSHA